ncbi:hypothetical protein Acsp03_50030 [Actinomadura sp. NBRC 104412]|nr:hypothetical protein Acsp03_50030 [Actinomadura sp. NBRC 104412]
MDAGSGTIACTTFSGGGGEISDGPDDSESTAMRPKSGKTRNGQVKAAAHTIAVIVRVPSERRSPLRRRLLG